MIGKFISYAIIGIVVTLLLKFFNKASKATPVINSEGNEVLKLPILYGIIGLISFIPGFAILLYGIIDFNPKNILPQLFLFALMGGLGAILILQQWVSKVIMTEKEIIKITMFGRVRKISWNDIETITFNRTSLELKIQSKESKIKCHMHLVGFPKLVERLEKETNITKNQMNIPTV